jgi:hypothetical protein
MPTTKETYSKAMDLAEEAFLAQKKGCYFSAYWRFKKSLKLVEDAIYKIPENDTYETTKYILNLSAKSIANNIAINRRKMCDGLR